MGSTLVIEAPGTVRLIQRSILFTKSEGDVIGEKHVGCRITLVEKKSSAIAQDRIAGIESCSACQGSEQKVDVPACSCFPLQSVRRSLVFLRQIRGALCGVFGGIIIDAPDFASAEFVKTPEFFLGCRSLGYLAGRFLPNIVCDLHPRFNRFVTIPVVVLPKIRVIVVNKEQF